jgi:hypothetical protein
MLQILGKSTSINVRKILWLAERTALRAVTDYYERLSQRPAFLAQGRNGVP